MGKDTCHYFQPFLKVCSKLSFISVSFQKEFDKAVSLFEFLCQNYHGAVYEQQKFISRGSRG